MTHRSPRYLLRILNRFDELHALLFLLLEHHYLSTYSSSFTEHFYSLKRSRVLRTKGGEVPRAQLSTSTSGFVGETLRLRRGDIWLNLAVLIAVPYVKRKLDDGFEIHVPQAAAGAMLLENRQEEVLEDDATLRQRIFYIYKWFLRKVYPGLNATYYLTTLAFNLAYLFDKSKYHTPLLWLINTRMRRMSAADHRAVEQATSKTQALTSQGQRPGLSNSILNPRVLAGTVLSSTRFLLPASIFALKLLEWWHASDFARQLSRKATEGLVLPPPIIRATPKAAFRKQASAPNLETPSEKHNLEATLKVKRPFAPIAASTHLPIFTVPPPQPTTDTDSLCPICTNPIVTATASPYGYVYCYTCIHRWVDGTHERQIAFMDGRPWADDEDIDSQETDDVAAHNVEDEGYMEDTKAADSASGGQEEKQAIRSNKEGRWESGAGRCAITGRKILGGTEGLRRVVV